MGQITEPSASIGTVSTTEGSFLTNPPAPDRNNLTVAVGFQFQVTQPITVTSLGRYYTSSGASHTINLWAASDTAAPLATATVSGSAISGQASIVYATITPVTLNPGNVYAIAIDEQNGGDLWVDDWQPGAANIGLLNTIITNIVESYGVAGAYPLTTSSVGRIYDTPSMIFTTAQPLLTSGLPSATVVTGASGETNVVTAANSNTPMVYFMRSGIDGTPPVWPVGSYIGAQGEFETNAWILLAGNAAMTMPYPMPSMLGILPDVAAGLIFETSTDSPTNYAYGVLDASGNFRFSQQNDGSHCWGNGANSNHSLNDVCLARTAAGALEVNTGTAGSYTNTKFTAGGNVLDTNGVTLAGATQPTCSASLAGKLWYSGHKTGVKDSAAICAADATNAFAWRTIY